MKDYGCAWRILRLPSLTDQIFIKAQRIRGLQQNKTQRVDEGASSEFIGIINYYFQFQLTCMFLDQYFLSSLSSYVLDLEYPLKQLCR